MATENPKRHKSPGIDQIPVELIKAGSTTFRSEIHKLIISIWNKEWEESSTIPVYEMGYKAVCSNYRHI
jgi:hypothetical protein